MNVLDEIREAIGAATWRPKEPLDREAVLYGGTASDWTVQVVALGEARMGTAVHAKKLLIVKMTDEFSELALSAARAALAESPRP
jgi:hypothetical protein